MTPSQWGLLAIAVISGSAGAILLKSGAPLLVLSLSFSEFLVSLISNWRLLIGIFLYIVPSAIIIYLLRFVDVSFLQPILALTYVVTPVIAVLFLQENISLLRAFGIGIIILGVTLVANS